MILDNRALFSDAQAITATTVSTNSYDLGQPGISMPGRVQLLRSMGKGKVIPFVCVIDQTFNNLTSLAIVMQEASDSAFTTPVEVFRINVPLAQLVKGYVLPMDKLPRGINLQYLQMRYEVTGTAPTQGTITAGIVAAVDASYQG
ncbi:MAG TPA: hypothetical protein VFM18_01110 [Methanosarcina sp.]|nr:hypothetical protein [Methanosarcina sp.]